MGILDKAKGKVRQWAGADYVVCENGRKVPTSDIGQFIVKVYNPDEGGWVVPNIDGATSVKPIEKEAIEDLDEIVASGGGVKVAIYGTDNKFMVDYWKIGPKMKSESKQSGSSSSNVAGGVLKEIREASQTFAEIGQAFGDIRENLKPFFPEVEQIENQGGGGQGEEPREEPKTFSERLKEEKERYKTLKQIFGEGESGGGGVSRDKYPMWANMVVDKEFREGAREMVNSFVRDIGASFKEGLEKGYEEGEKKKGEETPPVFEVPEPTKPSTKYRCDVCGDTFKSEESYKSHMNAHKEIEEQNSQEEE